MGVLDRFEKGVERAVNGAFAKAFRSEVQPVEIASALRRESDDKARTISRERTLAPNAFVVELGPADQERLGQWESALATELEALVAEHVSAQRYHVAGPIQVTFEEAPDLDTGLFRVRSAAVQDDAPAHQAVVHAAPQAAPAAPAAPPAPPVGIVSPAGVVYPNAAPPAPSAPLRRPVLEVAGERYEITKPVTVIGRGSETDVMLDDAGASRRHAEVHVVAGAVRIVDLGSTNGTFVDGKKQPVSSLVDGSVITIGRTRIVFHTGDAASMNDLGNR